MFLGMQDFDFCPDLIKFYKIFYQILPNLIQVLPNFTQFIKILSKFAQIGLNLPIS